MDEIFSQVDKEKLILVALLKTPGNEYKKTQ